ncbi:MAG TPA: hypothetical protein VIF57_11690 [Polyangia bacterium]|jgi:hypothetical protein
MNRRGSLVVAAALLAASAPARTAHADGVPIGWPHYALMYAPVALFPSEVGVVVRPSGANFVFGWSCQVPFGDQLQHRIAGNVDLLLRSSGVDSAYGRLGYRYTGRRLFAGAGAGIEPGAVTVSPELGVKLAHHERDYGDGLDTSVHVVARADLAAATGGVSATILLGWNAF